jgi:cardiolipin synthase
MDSRKYARPRRMLRRHSAALRRAVLIVGFAVLGGCAGLPDVDHELEQARVRPVVFEDAHGPVPEAQSQAILDRLEDKTGATDILQQHLAHEQAFNLGSPLVLGNKLLLLQDGPATYKAMLADIRAAKDHINFETYIFDDDETGRQFADLLLEKRAQGVQVNLIYDSVGCLNTPVAFFDRLRKGGIQVLEFNPINPLADNAKVWKLNNRDHRKLLVIDGRIVFIGGVNISKVYSSGSGGSRKKQQDKMVGWRDTHIRIEGPVAAEFQKLFLDTWSRQQGPPLQQKNFFPEIRAQGNEIVRAIGDTADNSKSTLYLTLMSAILHAERDVHLTNAYFAPDKQLLKALTDTASRGVEVTMVLPGYTDSWMVFSLGRSYYKKLLSAGVKIYERHDALMHAKTASIDGVWSTVGSTNLDWRSFLHNDEVNAVILGRDFALQMDAMFAEDLAASERVTLEQWRHRPFMCRVQEFIARLCAYWL